MEESHGKKAKQPVAANSQGKKKNGTPVQQLQGTEFCQQTGSLGKDPKLQMHSPGQHLGLARGETESRT